MNLLLLNLSKMESSSYFELNTQGLCLICLAEDKPTNKVNSSLKLLLRYLNINAHKLCNFSGSFLDKMDSLEDTGLKASLCPECSQVIKKFSKLYQSLEYIRMQLDTCLKTVHSRMENAKGEKEAEYERRMRSRNLSDMFNASVVDNLRQETFKKCTLKVQTLTPRVSLLSRDQKKLMELSGKRIPGPKSKTRKPSPLLENMLNQPITNPIPLSALLGPAPPPPPLPKNLNNGIVMDVEVAEDIVVKVEPIPIPLSELDLGTGIDLENQIVGACQIVDHELDVNTDPEKKFHCTYCPKSFAAESSLHGHLHIHKNRVITKKTCKKNKKIVLNKVVPAAAVGIQKKRVKCTLCKKIFTSQMRLRNHMKDYHGKDMALPAGKKYDCEVCGRQFMQNSIYRTHMMSKHTRYAYSKYLPEEISAAQLDGAVRNLMKDHRPISDPAVKKSLMFGCQFCGNVFPHPSHYRLHLLRSHDREVVTAVESYEGNEDEAYGEYEPEMATLSSILEDAEGGMREREEEEEIEPQPILLRDVYSLNGGAVGEEEGESMEVPDKNETDPLMED